MIPELLAPAGGLEALKAAVSAGADAVYLGAAAFGARAAVGFSSDELKAAIRFAHLHSRKIYVTVNTLVKDGELPALRDALRTLRDLYADAVLIQDLGVLRLCREEFPELTLHASTQMSLHTPEGVRWAARNGISRVVLNREATMDDIRAAVRTGVEIEVFAHGALCVCVSGQCALSSSLGERSGNRGRCAQPCRLPYRYRGSELAWLSPADLCTLPILPALAGAGIASLKLEGRLKRPEYVYIVTDVYRRALDRLNTGDGTADPEDADALRQIFCRGRFTGGYAAGGQDADILNPGHTAHEGIQLGTIRQAVHRGPAVLAEFVPTRMLSDQDGLSVGADKCIYTGPDIPAGQTAVLRLHQQVPAGTPVLRTESALQLEQARSMFADSAFKRLCHPFKAFLSAIAGRKSELTLTCGGVSVTVTGPTAVNAEKRALSEEIVRQSLEKTGNSPFRLADLETDIRSAYLSSAQMNAMRREALGRLEEAVLLRSEQHKLKAAVPALILPEPPAPLRRMIVRTERPEEIPALLESGADHILLTLPDATEEALRSLAPDHLQPETVTLQLPPVASDEAIHRLACLARRCRIGLAADNAGQLQTGAGWSTEGIPVFNAETERTLAGLGVHSAVLSPELSGEEIRRMPSPALERVLCVYGRQRLMLLSHCPERVKRGLSAGHEQCRLCETGGGLRGQFLTDRKGILLPLIPYRTERGCVVRLYSGAPVSLIRYMPELRKLPLSFLVSFTDEPTPERLHILKAFTGVSPADIKGTAEKYMNGVL